MKELHNVELGKAYCNNNMCGEFIDYIATNLALKVIQMLKSSNFHRALWDGTTNLSVYEKEAIFMLYLDKVRNDREAVAETEFLALAEVSDVPTERIKHSVYESFEQIGR